METIVKVCALCSNSCSPNEMLCDSHLKIGKNKREAQKQSSKPSRFSRAPFVSVEIETSGLDPKKNSLLEVVMVFGTFGQTSGGISQKIHFYIHPGKKKIIWDKEAKDRVGHLTDVINGKVLGDGEILNLESAQELVRNFLSKCLRDSGGWKIQFLGKNIYGFIIPFLKENGLFFEDLIDHNSLDFRSLFYIPFGQRAELKKVCEEYKVPLETGSALNEAVTMLSCLYEAVAHREGLSTDTWY